MTQSTQVKVSKANDRSHMWSVGFDIGGTNLKAALVTMKGQILHKASRPVLSPGRNFVLVNMKEIVQDLFIEASKLGLEGSNFCGIGIGWPGPVNRKDQSICDTPNLSNFTDFN